jgi:hypothetical protein
LIIEVLGNSDAEELLKVPDNLIRSCADGYAEFRLDFLVDTLQREPTYRVNVLWG